jgi:hypothetical protein
MMDVLVTELVSVLRKNRYRHGRAWRKVRVDRLGKCFAWDREQFTLVLDEAMRRGLVTQEIRVMDDVVWPAVKVRLE